MLEKVKMALRISHNLLDSDINDTISTARSEMIRSGIAENIANSDIDIIQMAIKTYCLYVYASDTKLTEGYFKSWQYQLDNIRKSTIILPEEVEG
jgi:uncharacterized phage protein (predicted DNA packaging)